MWSDMWSADQFGREIVRTEKLTTEEFRGQDGTLAAPNSPLNQWGPRFNRCYLENNGLGQGTWGLPAMPREFIESIRDSAFRAVIEAASALLKDIFKDTCEMFGVTLEDFKLFVYWTTGTEMKMSDNAANAAVYVAELLDADQEAILVAEAVPFMPKDTRDPSLFAVEYKMHNVLERGLDEEEVVADAPDWDGDDYRSPWGSCEY